MADGMWLLGEDGTFELQEPYCTQLLEARWEAARAWTEALITYLVPRCPYDAEYLVDELSRRTNTRPGDKVDLFEEYVLEALSGDL